MTISFHARDLPLPARDAPASLIMRILVLDGSAETAEFARRLLEGATHSVVAVTDPEAAHARALDTPFAVIFVDVAIGDGGGLAWLRRFRDAGGTGAVVMTAADGWEGEAFRAVREPGGGRGGAFDVVRKPFVREELLLTLQKVEEQQRLERELDALRTTLRDQSLDAVFVGESAAMRGVLDAMRRAARSRVPVILTGEPGTGKRFVARSIHREGAVGHAGSVPPFVSVTCAGTPAALLEATLFGESHGGGLGGNGSGGTRSAPGEARGGTLFLDQIDAAPPAIQARLAREFVADHDAAGNGVRWIAASDEPLEWLVDRGLFDAGLFQRLDGIRIELPPLRDRREDIPALVTHFVLRAAERLGRPVSLTPRALQGLLQHDWPENVRGLRGAIDQAAALNATGHLDLSDFALALDPTPRHRVLEGMALKPQLEALEREVIARALAATAGNRREASKLLRVSLRTLFYKLRRYGMEV